MNSKFMEVMQGCKVDVDQHHKQVHVALQCHDELRTKFMWDWRTAATFMSRRIKNKNNLELTRNCKMDVEQQREPTRVGIQHHDETKSKFVLNWCANKYSSGIRSWSMEIIMQKALLWLYRTRLWGMVKDGIYSGAWTLLLGSTLEHTHTLLL